MIKMHYAKGIDLSQGIEELYIKSMIDLEKFIKDIVVGDNKETVYLYTDNADYLAEDDADYFEEDDDDYFKEDDKHLMTILVTANPNDMYYRVKSMDLDECTIHIQEYESFESAYAVALNMREIGKLCYDKK